MTADELIDTYVANVVMLLPRGQRRDVAQELRVLLREEADAAASGQASREQAARALLAGFARLTWRRATARRSPSSTRRTPAGSSPSRWPAPC